MIRVRSVLVTVMALVLGGAFVAAAQAQDRAPRRTRRRFGRGLRRGSLLGLLSLEQVQKELKLSKEQVGKVKKVGEQFASEMRKHYAALRKVEDREKRRAKITELAARYNPKTREQLCDILAKEQMTRLCQIRMQVRATLENLSSKDVADELKLTEDQKKTVAAISKDMQAKRSELFRDMRNASREQRTAAFQKYRKLSAEADKQALAVLTAEQSKAFEEMKGKKIELKMRRRRR